MNFSSLSPPFLKEERKRLGFSQAEMAERCGVSREIWGRYERGAAAPGGDVLKALADLGADVQYILTGSGHRLTNKSNAPTSAHLPPDEQLLLEAYRGLSPAKKKQLLAELLTGAAGKKPVKAGGIVVSGSGNRTAGGNFHEKE